MGELNTYAYVVNRLSGYGDNTYHKERVYLYDDFTQFVDYGRFGNESYISIYIDDDGVITGQGPAVTGYIYASSTLFTKRDGTPTDCHIFDYIGANGVLMHAYTRIPDMGEDLVESFTTSGGNVDLIDNPDDFRYGAVLYLVSSKGNNGNNGSYGGQASGSYNKTESRNYVYRGGGGSGGSGGSGGKGVSIALTLANFLEDGTADFDNGVTTGTIVHAGEAGAGGGGGGGGEGGYYNKNNHSDLNWSAGAGGAGGYANVASQTNRIYIPHNVAVKCTSYSHTSGPSGSTGSSGGGGGSSIANFGNSATISGGAGGRGGNSGNGTSGSSGGYAWGPGSYRGGNGGAGASENNVSTKTTVDKTIDGKRVYTTAHDASSSYSIANSLASTGGMALAKLVPYYTT